MNREFLDRLVGAHSVVGDATGNAIAQELLVTQLERLGFVVHVEGGEQTDQPCIIARREPRACDNQIVLYGHYDVARVGDPRAWQQPDPLQPMLVDGRLYGRGIADNKGPLVARLTALAELDRDRRKTPGLLWLIQGEEEIDPGPRVAQELFARHLGALDCPVVVEETGTHDRDSAKPLLFLWSPGIPEKRLDPLASLLADWLPSAEHRYRHLNKLGGSTHCPLLSNLKPHAVYLGFGPNDHQHRIHHSNESLNWSRLQQHTSDFAAFLTAYANSNFEQVARDIGAMTT